MQGPSMGVRPAPPFPRHPNIPPCSVPMSHQVPCPAAIEGPDPVVLGRLLCELCQLTLLALGLAAERDAGCWCCRDLKHSHQCSALINYPLTFTFISLSAAVTQQGQSLPPRPHRCPPRVYFCFFFTCMLWHESVTASGSMPCLGTPCHKHSAGPEYHPGHPAWLSPG